LLRTCRRRGYDPDMIPRALVLLALLLAPAAGETSIAPLPEDPSVAAHILSSSRKDLKVSRDDLKALSPDERGVVRKSRGAVAETASWKALAPAFGAAADMLERAGEGEGPTAELCVHMAKSYRAMADEIDKDASYLTDEQKELAPAERAEATYATAEALLAAAVADKEEVAAEAWSVMKRVDPRCRALALNAKTLGRGFATLTETEHDAKPGDAIAKAAKLQEEIEPVFEGVRTSRDGPEPTPAPAPKKRYPIRIRR
jgi:hypothetical protein